MIIEVKVPSPGESISEVQLASWLVEDGDYVHKDQEIAEIDSDKATLSISAEEAGTIALKASQGDSIEVGSVIASINTDATAPEGKAGKAEKSKTEEKKEEKKDEKSQAENKTGPAPAATGSSMASPIKPHLSPLARKLLEANQMSESEFLDFLKNYRFSKKDVSFVLENKANPIDLRQEKVSVLWKGNRDTERKKMSTLRLKLSERLVSVKNETAMLTTFNEVDMYAIMNIRQQYKDSFKEKYGVSLGFMSFFTRAIILALQEFPQINAQIDGDELVYHHYADIGIAVSTPKGLMVPVLRNAEKMSMAEIELKIKDMATKARDNKISLDEMKGGTFTITNGGVFGSMLSTPILNPPQSAILGMHNIVDRPVAIHGQVVIRPVMYVALSYDHRVIDGRESVSFLYKVKELLENPVMMMFEGSDPASRLLGL